MPSDPTPATVVGQVKDERPEPGPFPDLWTTTSWYWSKIQKQWMPFVSCSAHSHEEANSDGAMLLKSDHRNVRIIKIPGDATGGGQQA